mgnify:CR=1 FL=1
MKKINNKYELAKLFALKLNVLCWNTQKNDINKKIDEFMIFNNSEKEIKAAIEEIKTQYNFKYNIFPIYTKKEYAPEIKEYGLIIE